METTDNERKKYVKKDMGEMTKRNDTVNEKMWNLETRMDTMSKDKAESSCAIQSKLHALLRNSIAQDKSVTYKQPGTRVDFVEPQRKKRESTPLQHMVRSDQNCYERGSLKLDEDTWGFKCTQGCTTRCYDLGEYLGNDEQDT